MRARVYLHVLSVLVLPTCITICSVARGFIVLYVLMFGVVHKPVETLCDDGFFYQSWCIVETVR